MKGRLLSVRPPSPPHSSWPMAGAVGGWVGGWVCLATYCFGWNGRSVRLRDAFYRLESAAIVGRIFGPDNEAPVDEEEEEETMQPPKKNQSIFTPSPTNISQRKSLYF